MSSAPQHILVLPKDLCRKCVRSLSRRLRDLSGVVWFEIDTTAGQVLLNGDVDAAAAEAMVRELGCS
jgi:hypothetical protein